MKKGSKIAIGLGALFVINRVVASVKTAAFKPVNDTNLHRECDPYGCGYFGAPRGNRTHKGVDFVTYENQAIKAPFDCTILRNGYPYSDDTRYRLVEIKGLNEYSKYTAKVMYVKLLHPIDTKILKGQTLCTSDDVSRRYDSRMTTHVHFELYKNGVLINPEPFFV